VSIFGSETPQDNRLLFVGLGTRTEDWFRHRNEALLAWALGFVPWIIQQAFFEGALENGDNVVVHRGDGAVVFSDASGFTALTERLSLKSNGAELLSQCLTSFFTPLIDIINAYRGDVIKFSGDALTIYFPAVDDTKHPRYRTTVPPHGTYGLPDIGPMATSVLRAAACCIEIHKRLDQFQTGVDGVVLCLHIGVGCGPVTILQVGGVVPPETKVARYEYVIAGPPIEQISVAEPLAKNGETCVSPQAWEHIRDCVVEGRKLDTEDFHIVVDLDQSKYTFPTVRNAAKLRDARAQYRCRLSELALMRRYIPSAVFKQIECGTLTYVNEMRLISTVFISGSGVDVSTDEGAHVAQELMSSIQKCCYGHEGTLNKYLVDDKGMLFLLVFGLPPLVHTDDATRAVIACRDMVQVFKKFGLVGRFGVTTGRNYCGLVGSATRMEYTVLGDTVNLAARLMANAAPLSILVDEATHARSCREIRYKALEPIKVKGKSNLIPIFEPEGVIAKELLGLTQGNVIEYPWEPMSVPCGGTSRLLEVSAWRELRMVKDLLQETAEGKKTCFASGGVWAITGETGTGQMELLEFLVNEVFHTSGALPIFGTMGSRPGHRFLAIEQLLRSMAAALRHASGDQQQSDYSVIASLSEERDAHLLEFLRSDLTHPGQESRSLMDSEGLDLYKQGLHLVGSVLKNLTAKRPVCCVLSFRPGSDIYRSSRSHQDKALFWTLAHKIAEMSKSSQNPLVLILAVKGGVADIPEELHAYMAGRPPLTMSMLNEYGAVEYMSKYMGLQPDSVPDALKNFIITVTQGNPLYIHETLEQLIAGQHLTVSQDGQGGLRLVNYTDDLESINLKDWANTAMVGSTIALLESLDPVQAAVVKMATVFRGVFTVADLCASSCSKWAGAYYFDAFRVFHAVSLLVDRGILALADDNDDRTFLGKDSYLFTCYKLSSVLARKVGEAMVLEAQKKVVKRQALMERALAKDLPERMDALRRKKNAVHIPWYYQIEQQDLRKN